jgi:hypothetical protein
VVLVITEPDSAGEGPCAVAPQPPTRVTATAVHPATAAARTPGRRSLISTGRR